MSLKQVHEYIGPNSLSFMMDQERKHWLLRTNKLKHLIDPNTGDTYQGRIDNLGSDIVVESRKLGEVYNQLQYVQYSAKFSKIFQTEPSAFTYNSSTNGMVFARIISTNFPYTISSVRHYRIHFRDCEVVYLPFGTSNSSEEVYAYKWIKTNTNPVIKLMDTGGTYSIEVPLSFQSVDKYVPLTTEPADWSSRYYTYYIKTATGYQLIPNVYTNAPQFQTNMFYDKQTAIPEDVEFYYPLDETLQPLSITALTQSEWYTEGIINENQIGLPAFWFTCDMTNLGPYIKLSNNTGSNNCELFCVGNNGNASKYKAHLYVDIDGHYDATPTRVNTNSEYVYVSPAYGYSFAGNVSDFNVPLNASNIKMGTKTLNMDYPGAATRFYMSQNTEWTYVDSTSYKIKVSTFDGNCYAYHHDPLIPCIDIQFDESISMGVKTNDYGFMGIRGGSGTIIIPKSSSDAIVIPQSCVSEVQDKKFVYLLGKDNKVKYTEIKVDPQNDGNYYVVLEGLKTGDKYVTNGITKLSDGMEIVPITPEKYQQKIKDQAKAMSAGDIVGAMKK